MGSKRGRELVRRASRLYTYCESIVNLLAKFGRVGYSFLLRSSRKLFGYFRFSSVEYPVLTAVLAGILVVVALYLWLRIRIGWDGYWFQLEIWMRSHPLQTSQLIYVYAVVMIATVVGVFVYGLKQARHYFGLDKQSYGIWRLQRSTKTLLPVSVPVHEQLRMRFSLYRWWHTQRWAQELHYLILIGVIAGLGYSILGMIPSAQANGCSDVAISGNTTWSTNQCYDDVTITSGATLTIAGNTTHTLGTLTLGDGGSNGFINAQGDTVNGVGIVLDIETNIEVKSGSSITSTGQGYAAQSGPGAGTSNSIGASHGGMGLNGLTSTYGSVTAPVALGSGGSGSAGAGAIKIIIGGNLTNSGTISANSPNTGCTGQGTGGSVWINFTGGSSVWGGTSGTISANGGSSCGGSQASSSGGRVAVTGYVSDTHTGTTIASGGSGSASGTVYTKSSGQNGTLFVDNNSVSTESTIYTKINTSALTLDTLNVKNQGRLQIVSGETITIASSGSVTGNSTGTINIASGAGLNVSAITTVGGSSVVMQNDSGGTLTVNSSAWTLGTSLRQRGTLTPTTTDLTVASGGILTSDVAITQDDVTVQSGGTINHSANTTAETYKLDLTATGNLSVNSGGLIDVVGLGYSATNGPGAGTSNSIGASYGGMGYGGTTSTYGSPTAPVSLGSGGSGNGGGGAIKLSIAGNLTNSGTIRANSPNTGCTGQGSGGSVWINFTGGSSAWGGTSGTISANGGSSCGGSQASSSGGRVAVTGYVSDTHTGTTSSYGGSSPASMSGTVYTKSTSQTYGTLLVDNNSISTSGLYAKTNGSLTVDVLTVQNVGKLQVPSGETVTIASSGSMSGNSAGVINIVSGGALNTANIATVTGPSIENDSGGTLSVNTSGWTLTTSLRQRGTLSPTTTDLIIGSGGTLTADVATTQDDVTVQSGGTINHSDNSSAETYKLDLTTTGNLTINSSGSITTLGLGYDAGYGPGTPASGSGAAHGGMGYNGTASMYGSVTAPNNLGSGSYGGTSGGGAIKLAVGGNFANSGTISANAATGACANQGSGGSVWIAMTGGSSAWSGTSGTISANGGSSCSGSQISGAGGRIAITGYVSDSHSGTTSAYGGSGPTSMSGTVYTKSTSQTYGTLTVNNNNITTTGLYAGINTSSLTLDTLTVENRASLQIESGQTVTGTTKTVSANSTLLNRGTLSGATDTISGTLVADGTTALGDVTVTSGGVITHSANTTTETYKAVITADSMDLQSGGLIDLNSLGYTGGSASNNGNGVAPGLLGGASSAGGGGGYGGGGATGAGASGGAGGSTYGSSSAPVNIGSGGGGGVSAGGGAGGGATQITITGNLTVAGTIRANGSAGTSGTHGGGGGSGGSIYLIVGGNFNCTSGTLTANGGNGAGSTNVGGGGGGGRIAQNVSGTYTACTTRTATKGTGGTGGADGTVYSYPATPTSFSNSASTSSSVTWTWTDNSTTETSFRLQDASHSEKANITSTTTGATGGGYSYEETSLTPNTQYTRHIHAHDGTAESSGSGSSSKWTLAATPGAPTVSAPTTTTLSVAMTTNGNPSSTEFAFGLDNDNNGSIDANSYVQSNGSLGASAVWQTNASWGTKTVTGLSINTGYSFKAKARNSENTETALSSATTLYTIANAPGAPDVSSISPTSSTITVILDQNGNPSGTTYVLQDINSSSYVQSDGTLGAGAVWQTYASWGGASGKAVTSLPPNTSYTFSVKARNGDNVETAAVNSSALATLANTPSAPTATAQSQTAILVVLSASGNPAGTEYALYNDSLGQYLTTAGARQSTPVFATRANFGGDSGVIDTGLTAGTTYAYKVKAKNLDGVETAFGSALSLSTNVATASGSSVDSSASSGAVTKKNDVATPSTPSTPSSQSQKNSDLPPGLDKRIELPPGLEKQCSSSDPSVLQQVNNFMAGRGRDISCPPVVVIPPSPAPCAAAILCSANLRVNIDPPGGTFNDDVKVKLSVTPTNVPSKIFYTLDGSEPDQLSTLYRGEVALFNQTTETKKITIKARAFGSISPIAEATFTIAGYAPTPTPPSPAALTVVAEPTSGAGNQPITVSLIPSRPASIYYTADGSQPTTESLPYLGPITFAQSTVLSFIGRDAAGTFSAVGREEYIISTEPSPVILTWSPLTQEASQTDNQDYSVYCDKRSLADSATANYVDQEARPNGCYYEVVTMVRGVTYPASDVKVSATNIKLGPDYPVAIAELFSSTAVKILIALSGLGSLASSSRPFMSWVSYFVSLLYLLVMGLFRRKPKSTSISGRVLDYQTSRPIGYAIVRLLNTNNQLSAVTTSNKRGMYWFNPAPGDYKLEVIKSEYYVKRPQDYRFAGEQFTLEAGKRLEIDLHCAPSNMATSNSVISDVPQVSHLGRIFLIFGTLLSTLVWLQAINIWNSLVLVAYGGLWIKDYFATRGSGSRIVVGTRQLPESRY